MHPQLFSFLLLSTAMAAASSPPPFIGAVLNANSPSLPSPPLISSHLHSSHLYHLLLLSPSPSTLRSFLFSPISLSLSLPHNLTVTDFHLYLSHHLLPFHPRLRISALLLHVNANANNISSFESLKSSLSSLGLPSFPISPLLAFFDSISPTFPPSSAKFKPHVIPILHFLRSTTNNSSLHISLFPFPPFHHHHHHHLLSIAYATFHSHPNTFRYDPNTHLRYHNLFDEMLDSVFTALEREGFGDVRVVVAGTGWPTGGGEGATVGNAEEYNWGLVRHVIKGLGTPMRRRGGIEGVYVHEVFDEINANTSDGEWERHWGIWYGNLSAKYDAGFFLMSGANAAVFGMAFGAVWWLAALVFMAQRL